VKSDVQTTKPEKVDLKSSEIKPEPLNTPSEINPASVAEPPQKKSFSFNAKAAEFTPSFVEDGTKGKNQASESSNQCFFG
jgi:hypothetical protein